MRPTNSASEIYELTFQQVPTCEQVKEALGLEPLSFTLVKHGFYDLGINPKEKIPFGTTLFLRKQPDNFVLYMKQRASSRRKFMLLALLIIFACIFAPIFIFFQKK